MLDKKKHAASQTERHNMCDVVSIEIIPYSERSSRQWSRETVDPPQLIMRVRYENAI